MLERNRNNTNSKETFTSNYALAAPFVLHITVMVVFLAPISTLSVLLNLH